MYIEWTKHLKDPEEKARFEQNVRNSATVLDRLRQLCSEKQNVLDRNEMSIEVYNTPNWGERQAHKNGNRESLEWMKKLVDLDHQKDPTKP